MKEPGGDKTAAVGRGHLRASRADRERAIELLKVAFVQGRLTQGELEARVGLALASRTYADLADLTADIPAGPAAAEPAAEPAGMPVRTLAKAARRSGICMLVAFALAGVAVLTQSGSGALSALSMLSAFIAVIAAPAIMWYGVVDAWQQRRSRAQVPPRPRRDGRRLEGGQPGGTSRDPALPPDLPDQNRADLRSDSSLRGRPRASGRGARKLRGGWPAPGAIYQATSALQRRPIQHVSF